jgi:protein-tyrosine phosphatase
VIRHVAKTHGFSLSQHNSRPFTRKLVKTADVILVMEQYQKDAILQYFPEARGKTFRVMEYLWHDDPADIRDIPDPTGQDTPKYQEFVNTTHAEVERIFRELSREKII